MVEPTHQGSSPRLGTGARIFLDLFQDLTGTILSVIGDVPVDSEAPVVTSSILRIRRLNLWEVLVKIELRVCIHRCECVCICEHRHPPSSAPTAFAKRERQKGLVTQFRSQQAIYL